MEVVTYVPRAASSQSSKTLQKIAIIWEVTLFTSNGKIKLFFKEFRTGEHEWSEEKV